MYPPYNVDPYGETAYRRGFGPDPERDNIALQKTRREAENELRGLKSDVDQQRKRYEGLMREREDEVRHLMEELDRLRKEVHRAHAQDLDDDDFLRRLKDDLRREREANHLLTTEADALRLELDKRTRETRDLRDEAEHQRRLVEKKLPNEDEAERLRAGNKQLHERGFELERIIDDLKRKLSEAERELQAAVHAINGAPPPTGAFADPVLQDENRLLRERLHGLESELENIRRNIARHADNELDLTSSGSLYALLSYLRDSICDILFEVFVRSADKANQNRANSFVLFTLNISELKNRGLRGFLLLLKVYAAMRKIIRKGLPFYGRLKNKVLSGRHIDLDEMLTNEKLLHDMEFRDNFNRWVEQTLLAALARRKQERAREDSEAMWLFRLLSILYRTRYPVRGVDIRVDRDLQITLQDKICKAAHEVFARGIDEIPKRR